MINLWLIIYFYLERLWPVMFLLFLWIGLVCLSQCVRNPHPAMFTSIARRLSYIQVATPTSRGGGSWEVVERKLITVLPLIPVGRSRGHTLGACHHQLGIQSLLVFKLRHPFPAESGYVSVPADCQSRRADLRTCLWLICIPICTQSR